MKREAVQLRLYGLWPAECSHWMLRYKTVIPEGSWERAARYPTNPTRSDLTNPIQPNSLNQPTRPIQSDLLLIAAVGHRIGLFFCAGGLMHNRHFQFCLDDWI